MQKFNINNYVKIKLTEEGINILKKEHQDILEYYNNNVDKNGYVQMKLMEVMNIFGEYCHLGNPNVPFETDIVITLEYTEDKIDKEFSINNDVKIRLTEEGINVLKKQHEEMVNSYPNQPLVREMFGDFKMPEVDENGYTQKRLWEVMKEFGQYCHIGNNNPPFELTIEISEEDLKDIPMHGKGL